MLTIFTKKSPSLMLERMLNSPCKLLRVNLLSASVALICTANQLTGFYMRVTLVLNRLTIFLEKKLHYGTFHRVLNILLDCMAWTGKRYGLVWLKGKFPYQYKFIIYGKEIYSGLVCSGELIHFNWLHQFS